MQFTNLLVLIAAIGATAAPSKELHARTSGIKLSKIAGKWKVGWTGAKTSEQYTCSNNGLLNLLNFNCVSVLNGNTVTIPISILGAGSLTQILAALGLSGGALPSVVPTVVPTVAVPSVTPAVPTTLPVSLPGVTSAISVPTIVPTLGVPSLTAGVPSLPVSVPGVSAIIPPVSSVAPILSSIVSVVTDLPVVSAVIPIVTTVLPLPGVPAPAYTCACPV